MSRTNNKENLEPTPRKPVMRTQMEVILNFLEDHPQLVQNKCRDIASTLWTECASILNAIPDGAVRTGQQWSKYFSDWKYRIRRKALELKTATLGLKAPDEVPPLSPLEEKLLRLIGNKSLDGIGATNGTHNTQSDDEDFCVPLDPIPPTAAEPVLKDAEAPNPEPFSKPSRNTDSRKRKRPQTPELEDTACKEDVDINEFFSSDQDSDDDADQVPTSNFLQIEESKLAALVGIREELARAVDVITHIKDWLVQTNGGDVLEILK